jgi:hypothetical protein
MSAPRVHGRGLAALAIAAALGASACGPGDTIVVVLPGATLEADAGRGGPAGGGATTDAGPNAADAAAPGAGGATSADAGAAGGSVFDASAPRMDAETPRMDAGTPGADAGVRDASVDAAAPLPDPGPYGCADAPFYPDGTVCLVSDPCAARSSYLASASLQCMDFPNAEALTCASSSPYLRYGPDSVPPTTLLRIASFQGFPVRLRTPTVTTGARACPVECAGVPTAATGVMRFQLALPFRARVTVKVGAPWKVAVDLPSPFCVPPGAAGRAGCLADDLQTATVTVYTTDFYAPARDVLIDETARTACP